MQVRDPFQVAAAWATAASGLLAAIGVLAAWVVATPPPNYGCADPEPPGQAAAVSAYQALAVPPNLLAVLAALIAIVAIAIRHKRSTGRTDRLTLVLGVLALLLVISVLPLFLVAARIAALGESAPALTAGLAALLLVSATYAATHAAWEGRRGAAILPWALLFLGPGHLMLVDLQGAGPVVC